ncbi:hypothetical protein H6P81_015820 [Aristolochia fimbriata]|uniref:Uncharacterized protein n=1 Tax=Aristolochia fimbriata TaxID=158543 RepID=A0AAV7E6M2_ARIFI|nr:hypothetical protein H6P81_015820 [Aristolochia fimbriata]
MEARKNPQNWHHGSMRHPLELAYTEKTSLRQLWRGSLWWLRPFDGRRFYCCGFSPQFNSLLFGDLLRHLANSVDYLIQPNQIKGSKLKTNSNNKKYLSRRRRATHDGGHLNCRGWKQRKKNWKRQKSKLGMGESKAKINERKRWNFSLVKINTVVRQ